MSCPLTAIRAVDRLRQVTEYNAPDMEFSIALAISYIMEAYI